MFILGCFIRVCVIFYMAKFVKFLFVSMAKHGY